jgi:dTDP-4-amino-4,6-dideoxygalactose transaminase
MQIPILDLTPEIQEHWDEFLEATKAVFTSGQFINGPNVQAFEKEMAAYLGVKHALSCNSGTDALIIGLRAMGVEPGDEVITSPFTFFASSESVNLVGATPVFCDIDPVTFNLDVSKLESLITAKTKAIIPVHLYGQAVEMDPLLEIAHRHGIRVLEDVAQAMGGEYKGKKLGSLGHVGAFSFFPSKNLGAFGDGGLMTTNDDHLADQCRLLRAHGSRKRYYHEAIGYNSRLDEVQAAILRIKLRYLDKANEMRRLVARRYHELFHAHALITTPIETANVKHVYHQYTLRIGGENRDRIHTELAAAGITTMLYYPVPLHQLPVYRAANYPALPVTEQIAKEVISLPIWPTISPDTQTHVANVLKSILENR